VETAVVRAVGFNSIAVGACAEAERPNKKYIDIYMGLDVSASMGLAADEAGRDKLRALTGCAFACHEKEGSQTQSNFAVANENGIATRVDILRQATRAFAHDLLNPGDPSNGLHRNEYRLAMYSISDDAKKLLAPPSPFQSRIDDEIDRIQLSFNTQFDIAPPGHSTARWVLRWTVRIGLSLGRCSSLLRMGCNQNVVRRGVRMRSIPSTLHCASRSADVTYP
jgi:hypothetical protein